MRAREWVIKTQKHVQMWYIPSEPAGMSRIIINIRNQVLLCVPSFNIKVQLASKQNPCQPFRNETGAASASRRAVLCLHVVHLKSFNALLAVDYPLLKSWAINVAIFVFN